MGSALTNPRFFDDRAIAIDNELIADCRGELSAIDLSRLNFALSRAFVVTARSGAERGAHGHIRCRQLLIQAAGEIELELVFRGVTERHSLTYRERAILIEPPVWARQIYHGDPAVLVVLCDRPFDPADYFNDPEQAA
jgi:hypothetical protein